MITIEHNALTLRDYFAIAALPAVYADCMEEMSKNGVIENWRAGIAEDAYMMADAMIKAREQ